MRIDSELLHGATAYVSKCFAEQLPPHYTFHNMEHTLQVAKAYIYAGHDLHHHLVYYLHTFYP
jgi:hypothetical protein